MKYKVKPAITKTNKPQAEALGYMQKASNKKMAVISEK